MSCHRHRTLLFILCCSALLTTAARAGVPNSIRTATPVSASASATIQKDIDLQIKSIVDGVAALAAAQNDPKQTAEAATHIRQGRQTLIDNADNPNGNATAAYQDEYAALLAKSLKNLTGSQNSRQVRLNAAIVLGEVAAKVFRSNSSDAFADVATALLQSKEFETQLWGLKIAKYAIASDAIKNGKLSGKLDKLVVTAVENSRGSAELVEEAYRGLTFEPIRDLVPKQPQLGQLISDVSGLTLPDTLDLVEWRTQQFKAGPPVNPRAELVLTGFYPVTGLGFTAVNAKPETRDRTLKAFGELTCAQLVAIANVVGQGNQPDQDLVEAAKTCGSAMASFGGLLASANPPVAGAEGVAAAGNTISTISLSTSDAKLKEDCDGLSNALKAMNIQVSMP